jgi:hypothetical protein
VNGDDICEGAPNINANMPFSHESVPSRTCSRRRHDPGRIR